MPVLIEKRLLEERGKTFIQHCKKATIKRRYWSEGLVPSEGQASCLVRFEALMCHSILHPNFLPLKSARNLGKSRENAYILGVKRPLWFYQEVSWLLGPSGVHSPDQNLHIYVQLTPWPSIALSLDIREQEREMWDFSQVGDLPSPEWAPRDPKPNYAVLGVRIFSVMRRYTTRVSYSVSESVTLRTELTDVTLVSEDTY